MEETPTLPVEAPGPPKANFPLGVIIILILVGFELLAHLLGFGSPTRAGAFFLTGLLATLYSITSILVFGTIFYGILRRKAWARKLTITWYIIYLASAIANYLAFFADRQGTVQFIQDYLPGSELSELSKTVAALTSVFTAALIYQLAVGLIIMVYVYRRKEFFKN